MADTLSPLERGSTQAVRRQARAAQIQALWIWWTENTQKDARCAHGSRDTPPLQPEVFSLVPMAPWTFGASNPPSPPAPPPTQWVDNEPILACLHPKGGGRSARGGAVQGWGATDLHQQAGHTKDVALEPFDYILAY